MDKEWLAAFAKMTYGIYVLTTAFEDKINGMIASWASQISYDPPLITVAVHPRRYSHQLISHSGCFALHVLPRGGQGFLKRFKGPDPAGKFSGLEWTKGKTGCPILKDCIAWFDCRVIESFAPGNHTIFIGQVIDARRMAEDAAMSTADYEGVYTGKS